MNDLKTYILSAKVICSKRILRVKRGKVKNCFTELHAKSKFEDACNKKYPDFVKCEINSCYLDFSSLKSVNDIFKGFYEVLGIMK